MLIANYHTHTPRCFHAEGTEEQYVVAAIESGMKILGFSDHTPQWFPGDYCNPMRMYPEQLQEYCDSVRAVRKKYSGQIDIHLGVEAEYYPDLFDELIRRLRDHGMEYLLLGQHWMGNEIGETYCGRPTESESCLKRYYSQVMAAINTGCFTYIAHPDLLNFVGNADIYRKHIRAFCKEAASCKIPLEINILGLQDRRHYPNPLFWEIAAEENCDCIIGFDAHRPDSLLDLVTYEKALQIVRQYDLTLLDTVPLRPLG